MYLLPVMPGTHHQKDLVIVCVLRLDRFVDRNRSIDVLLIPEAMDEHHGHAERLGGQNLVYSLVAPEGVVSGMFQELAPEAYLFEPVTPTNLARRPGFHVLIVVVKGVRPPLLLGLACRFLVVDVR